MDVVEIGLSIGSFAVAGIVWLVRLEGRINTEN